MVIKGKLRSALAAEKGVDFQRLKQSKKHKAALRERKTPLDVSEARVLELGNESPLRHDTEENNEAGYFEEDPNELNLERVDESDTSESSIELEDRIPRKANLGSSLENTMQMQFSKEIGENNDEDQDEEDDIPISDLEDLADKDREDLVPHTRLTINNTSALLSSINRISVKTGKSSPFVSHQSIISSVATATSIPDVSDDLQRELAFYSQCLEAARLGRSRLLLEGIPFSRPKDYFAEMVKEDAHMEKVKANLVDEATTKKAAAEARKLRDLKKFGKQVQVAKLQERQQTKRETLQKIKTLKRKRQESSSGLSIREADVFDVAVDNEITHHHHRPISTGQTGTHKRNLKRQKKDEKYGFGGKKRHAKSGDAISSGDLSGFNVKKMKTGGRSKTVGTTRPGKSKRKSAAYK